MNVVMRKISEITPYAKNAKKHDKKQIANVAESIKQYGFVQPVVVDKDGVIVIGHCRVLGAKKLGMKEVPCVCVDDLTPEQVNALRIVDNKTNESDWDLGFLSEELPSLDLSAFDFDFGLPDEEEDAEEDNFDVDAATPEEPKSKIGDVYQLGRHRLMCGDSTKMEDVEELCGGATIDMLLTDPPYNVDYEGAAGKIKNDNMEDSAFRQFLCDAFSCAKDVMKPGAAFHIWHADSEGYNFRGACIDAGFKIRQCLIWVKNALVLGRQDFQWRHEPCLYGEKPVDFPAVEEYDDDHIPCLYGWKDGTHYWFKNRKQTTVLEFDKPRKSAEHPTMKPVKMFDYEMKCNTKRGENVLDLFGGSGTTVVAAEQNGRNAFVMEFDPKYVDVIIERWEALTGKTAALISDRSFSCRDRRLERKNKTEVSEWMEQNTPEGGLARRSPR